MTHLFRETQAAYTDFHSLKSKIESIEVIENRTITAFTEFRSDVIWPSILKSLINDLARSLNDSQH